MQKKSYLSVVIFILALSNMLLVKAIATPNAPNQFIQNIADAVLNIVKADDHKAAENKLIAIFEDAVDIEWMSKFALGRAWHNLDENQKHGYTKAYRQYLINTYVRRFGEYNGQKFTINDAKQVSQDNYVVYTTLVQADRSKADLKIDYRLSSKSASRFGHFRIVDIVFEGVSMITSQRAEFNEVANSQGVDALINMLEHRRSKTITKQ